MKKHLLALGLVLFAGTAAAQTVMPQALLDAIKAQGRVTTGPGAPEVNRQIKLFHMDDPAPRGVAALRDISYGPDKLQKLDIFYATGQAPEGQPSEGAPEGAAGATGAPRTIVITLHGGEMIGGDKHGVGAMDNVPQWLVQNGFVAVEMNYRLAPKSTYPSGNQDIALVIDWLRKNAKEYGGDGTKVILWGQSAGANLTADYLGHPEFKAKGPDLLAAVMFSPGRSYDINTYGTGGGPYYTMDKAKYTERSALPGMLKSKVPMFIETAEYDPPNIWDANHMAKDALCKAGNCPAMFIESKGHNHGSPLATIGTKEHQVSDPLLAFLKKYSK